ncbi:hypothetical protein F2Q70_00012597 [Brassica cretica]|uniref:Uncharacterized protein n=1 Tax=Brassica cretica TaxID=69181 RepID=A0A8S9LYM6_BRACR|nr:hypothetical protein F2Q70_00012597 [Brassica cretica]
MSHEQAHVVVSDLVTVVHRFVTQCLFSVWFQQRYKWWCDDGVVVCDEQNMSIILQKLQGSLHLSISQA